MEAIWLLAANHNLKVIEDAAHAAGSYYANGEAVGKGKSDAVAFSFYATKNLSTGEGGMEAERHSVRFAFANGLTIRVI